MNIEHPAWVANMRQSGQKLIEYGCPDCGLTNHSLRPDTGGVYSTAVICPHCRELHGRRVHGDGTVEFLAVARIDRR